MAIAANQACPKCRENKHDRTGDHLLVFEDGGMYCGRSHLHANGKPYYEKGEGNYIETLLAMEIDGSMRYTPSQFRALETSGKLNSEELRACALSGMSQRHRWEVSRDDEREEMMKAVEYDRQYFDMLPVRNLVSRGIRGDICRLFDVHVGLDEDGKVNRHYYPTHNTDLTWRGAVCRTLPKGFGRDNLGHNWGKTALFGMHVSSKLGGRKKKLLVVGGHLDAMAAYQMLKDQDTQGKYSYHVWSVIHGEGAMDDLLNNKEELDKFEEIIWGFDGDAAGRAANLRASKLFKGKSKYLLYPAGCKDANSCLQEGKSAEFIDAWFHPADHYGDTNIFTVDCCFDELMEDEEQGIPWFTKDLDPITYGIRENTLFVLCAGAGVGKTAFTKRTCFSLMEDHDVPVGVIYLEETKKKTFLSYASYYSDGKRLEIPRINDKEDSKYTVETDYTYEEKLRCVTKLRDLSKLHVISTEGDKSIEAVLRAMDGLLALGVRHIVVDNLTCITHKKLGNKVDSIDETMKILGNYKDEHPCCIFLISHLKRLSGDSRRTPHNRGGEVLEDDLRGSGSILMWATYCISIERDCFGSPMERRTTTLRVLKDRDGINNGKTVKLFGQRDGRLEAYDTADKTGIACDLKSDDGFDEY